MKEMSLVEHLDDLRKSAIRILIIVVVAFFVTYGFGEELTNFLLAPLKNVIDKFNGKIIYVSVLDKVLSQFQLSFWTSIIISSPLWFYQLWSFLKEALYESEIKVIRPFVFLGFLFFLFGVIFGYYVVIPLAIKTLLEFGVGDIEAYISMREYLVITVKVLVFLGVIFQMPNVLLILGFLEFVTFYSLKSARKYVLVGFAICSAMITPPDVITMLGVLVPLYILYEIGTLGVLLVVHPYLKKKYIKNNMVPAKNFSSGEE